MCVYSSRTQIGHQTRIKISQIGVLRSSLKYCAALVVWRWVPVSVPNQRTYGFKLYIPPVCSIAMASFRPPPPLTILMMVVTVHVLISHLISSRITAHTCSSKSFLRYFPSPCVTSSYSHMLWAFSHLFIFVFVLFHLRIDIHNIVLTDVSGYLMKLLGCLLLVLMVLLVSLVLLVLFGLLLWLWLFWLLFLLSLSFLLFLLLLIVLFKVLELLVFVCVWIALSYFQSF